MTPELRKYILSEYKNFKVFKRFFNSDYWAVKFGLDTDSYLIYVMEMTYKFKKELEL